MQWEAADDGGDLGNGASDGRNRRSPDGTVHRELRQRRRRLGRRQLESAHLRGHGWRGRRRIRSRPVQLPGLLQPLRWRTDHPPGPGRVRRRRLERRRLHRELLRGGERGEAVLPSRCPGGTHAVPATGDDVELSGFGDRGCGAGAAECLDRDRVRRAAGESELHGRRRLVRRRPPDRGAPAVRDGCPGRAGRTRSGLQSRHRSGVARARAERRTPARGGPARSGGGATPLAASGDGAGGGRAARALLLPRRREA